MFLPFLPEDNASLDEQTDAALQSINDDLAHLLRLDLGAFWKCIREADTLHACLTSYLQFARRAYDDTGQEPLLHAEMHEQLSKRVFMVYLRMVTAQEGGAPPKRERAGMLYDGWLLDVPKLLDLAALYGPSNPQLLRRLMSAVFALQPHFGNDVAELAPTLASNLADVSAALVEAAQRLRSGADAAAMQSLTDGVMYWTDAAQTLLAFVSSFPPAAGLLLLNGAPLLAELARLVGSLMPQLRSGFSAAAPQQDMGTQQGTSRSMLQRLERLRQGSLRLGRQLLISAYSEQQDGLSSNGSDSCGNAAAIRPAAGAARAGAGEWRSLLPATAAARGEALVAALTQASEHDSAATLDGGEGFLRSLNRTHHLDAAIKGALARGHITMDAVQQDYILVLLGSQDPHPAANGLSKASTGSTAAAARQAQQAATIGQIREVLPEYGEGFLAACLDAVGQDSERVIHQLLEGSLPPELARLDPNMPLLPSAAAAPMASASKGKGRQSAAESKALAALPAELSWRSLAMAEGPAALGSSSGASAGPSMQPSQAPPARPVHRGVSAFLDRTRVEERSAIRLHAAAAQWEYDDEYDDSFDDLPGGGADGVADVEGDDDLAAGRRITVPAPSVPPAQDKPGSNPSSRGPSPAKGLSGQRQHERPGSRVWLHEGRIFNYPKPGATPYNSQEAALQAMQTAGEEIQGLGRGGNVPPKPDQANGHAQGQPSGGGRGQGPPSAQQQPPGAGRGGRGRGRDSFAHKDKHKAVVANHHRKDRALRKTAGPPG